MGACDFTTLSEKEDLKEAYRGAVSQAQYEYGHAGYTGTIAETSGVESIKDEPLSDEDAYALAAQVQDAGFGEASDWKGPVPEKWGPAFAIKRKTGWLFFGIASS